MKKPGLVLIMLSIVLVCFQQAEAKKYEPTWKSLSQWEVPKWFDDAVLGIYCHWGVYSVPGFRFNDGAEQVDSGLWYGMFMYVPNNSNESNRIEGVSRFLKEDYLLVLIASITGISFFFFAQYSAIQLIGPSLPSLFVCLLAPVIISIFAVIFFKEKFTKIRLLIREAKHFF